MILRVRIPRCTRLHCMLVHLQINGDRFLERQEQRRKKDLLHELKLCGRTRNLERGKDIHGVAIESGDCACIYVATALVNMYARCGNMDSARQVFEGIKDPNVVTWTVLILGYAENEEGSTALDMFAKMKSRGCAPNSCTYVAVVKACTSLAVEQSTSRRAECLELGNRIHSEIGNLSNLHVQSSLVDMYSKLGSMLQAQKVFDSIKHPDVVSWTSLILGYAENGEGVTALEMFSRMRSQGCAPNSYTLVAALKACISLALEPGRRSECLERGREIHSEFSCSLNLHVQNTLIAMYANCGSVGCARRVFDGISFPDVVSWNALIMGYAENGESVIALDMFARMRSRGCAPNSFTFVAALKACASLGDLDSGCQIHGEISSGKFELKTILLNSLVDFYAKCGSMREAQKLFDSHPKARSLRTWTALLSGYSRVGDSRSVFQLFQGMQDAGFQPDGVTFLCILTCCSHAGLVEKANEVLEAMSTTYGIAPALEHYTCMVDLLGRSNKLDEAVRLVHGMPCRPNAVTWLTVLGACRKWKNVEVGRVAFKSLVSLEDTTAAAFVLMAHVYGSRGMFEEQEIVLALRKKFKVWKDPGQSCWISRRGEVHTFLVGQASSVEVVDM